jgi:hypothetical protein
MTDDTETREGAAALSAEEVGALRRFIGRSFPSNPGGPIAWMPYETWERVLATLDAAPTTGLREALDAILEFRPTAKFAHLDPRGEDLLTGVAAWMDRMDDVIGPDANREVQNDLRRWADIMRDARAALATTSAGDATIIGEGSASVANADDPTGPSGAAGLSPAPFCGALCRNEPGHDGEHWPSAGDADGLDLDRLGEALALAGLFSAASPTFDERDPEQRQHLIGVGRGWAPKVAREYAALRSRAASVDDEGKVRRPRRPNPTVESM